METTIPALACVGQPGGSPFGRLPLVPYLIIGQFLHKSAPSARGWPQGDPKVVLRNLPEPNDLGLGRFLTRVAQRELGRAGFGRFLTNSRHFQLCYNARLQTFDYRHRTLAYSLHICARNHQACYHERSLDTEGLLHAPTLGIQRRVQALE